MSNFNHAIEFAVHVHSGFLRKGTGSPYIVHPMEVAAIVSTMTNDEDILSAAVLHDTVEDAGATVQEIYDFFGPRVAELVSSETENKRPELPKSETWITRKMETVEHLRECKDPGIKMIALADKLSNLRATYQQYCLIGDNVWNRFNMKDKALHQRYFEEVLQTMPEFQKYPVYKEYEWYLEHLFG